MMSKLKSLRVGTGARQRLFRKAPPTMSVQRWIVGTVLGIFAVNILGRSKPVA
jgi:hypothetical protein